MSTSIINVQVSTTTPSKSHEMKPIVKSHSKSMARREADERHDNEDDRLVLSLQLFYFTYYASLGCLQPFLSLYYNSIGHGGQIIGLLGAISPAITVLVSPLWGHASDKARDPVFVLGLTILVSLVGHLLLLWQSRVEHIAATVALIAIFNSPIKPLTDAMVMTCLHDKTLFGQVRVFGLIGFGISNVTSGFILKTLDQQRLFMQQHAPSSGIINALCNTNEFYVLFVMHALLHIPAMILLQVVNSYRQKRQLSTKRRDGLNEASLMERLRFLFRHISQDIDAILFFVIIGTLGASSAVSDSFAFVRIREVGGNGGNMGLCRLFSTLAGIPMFYLSGRLARQFGIGKILAGSMLAFFMRFTIYGWMAAPHQAYLADAIRGLSYGVFWTASNLHATKIVPSELGATGIMLLNVCYNGVGRSGGSLVSGYIQSNLGTPQTFKTVAMWNLALGISFVVYLASHPHSGLVKTDEKVSTSNRVHAQETAAVVSTQQGKGKLE